MDSVEDVYNRLLYDKVKNDVNISLSDKKDLIKIVLSPSKYVLADDDMIEINSKKRLILIDYWTSNHWHPATFEDLYQCLREYII